MIRDQNHADENSFRVSRSRQEVLQDFEKLIEEKKLFGADRDPAIRDGAAFDRALVKEKGKGTRFLIRKVPSRAKLLRYWARLFENAIAPYALFDALSARIHEFEHRENRLLFGKGRVIYDTEIFQREEGVGELTLSFASLRDPALGVLAYLSGARFRVVYIEHIRLTVQKSGYASALFCRVRLLSLRAGGETFVVDCFGADPRPLFPVLQKKTILGHNLQFDLAFLRSQAAMLDVCRSEEVGRRKLLVEPGV